MILYTQGKMQKALDVLNLPIFKEKIVLNTLKYQINFFKYAIYHSFASMKRMHESVKNSYKTRKWSIYQKVKNF